jgi:hypothetical protein
MPKIPRTLLKLYQGPTGRGQVDPGSLPQAIEEMKK